MLWWYISLNILNHKNPQLTKLETAPRGSWSLSIWGSAWLYLSILRDICHVRTVDSDGEVWESGGCRVRWAWRPLSSSSADIHTWLQGISTHSKQTPMAGVCITYCTDPNLCLCYIGSNVFWRQFSLWEVIVFVWRQFSLWEVIVFVWVDF